jgi:hypothetical protein
MKQLIAFITVITILASCKKDPDKDNNSPSRTVRYEVSGNFTGSIIASYTTESGGTSNEQIASLPWDKEINYATNVTAAIIAVSGNGGVAGQKVTVIIQRGGSQIGTPMEVVANSSGSFSQAAPAIVF